MNRDHINIVKFLGPNDSEYKKVRGYIEWILQDKMDIVRRKWEMWNAEQSNDTATQI